MLDQRSELKSQNGSTQMTEHNPGDNEWDEHATGWDEDETARAYAVAAFSSLRAVLGELNLTSDRLSILDFGCGTGILTEQLATTGAAVHAVDTSPAMLAVLDAKITRNGWTRVTTGGTLPLGDPTYHLVVCSSVCSFLDDYPDTVRELASQLRSGGMFVQWDWEQTGDDSHGLTRAEIDEALNLAGLADVSVGVGFNVSVGDETMSPLMGRGRVAS